MTIHKTVRDLAIRFGVNVGRDHNGYYFVYHRTDPASRTFSLHPTAKSGVVLVKRHVKQWKLLAAVGH